MASGLASSWHSPDLSPALTRLQQQEAVLGQLIRRYEPCCLNQYPPRTNLLEAIAWGIIGQQIRTETAQKLFQRFLDYASPHRWQPDALAAVPPDTLRNLGISRYKTRFLKSWAQALLAGFPSLNELASQSDQDIETQLTAITGIGPWTAQLFLLFRLRRLDIFPNSDLGIRIGLQQLYGLSERPTAQQALLYGQAWRPYRSLASWYLWRSLSPCILQIHL